jgi:hypothetical protein
VKRKTQFLNIAMTVLVLVLAAGVAHAATVRGRLIHQNGYPAAGIAVTVINAGGVRCAPAYSQPDGMYYLFNIPPGPYYLEIWIYRGGAPVVYQIQVFEPYTDIPQIVVP